MESPAFSRTHHSASSVALVGGGNPPRPGEISLAHRGVLFLDELPEFNRHVLESLREPLESGCITISRAARQCEFPANFQLITAMNPCPCGYAGDPHAQCRCSIEQVQRYRARLSGPLLDRIDMHVEVPRLPDSLLTLQKEKPSEGSSEVRSRVAKARELQLMRQQLENAKLSGKLLEEHCALASAEEELLNTAIRKLQLSARAYQRILKVARTIADLANSDSISVAHLSEALGYRKLGK